MASKSESFNEQQTKKSNKGFYFFLIALAVIVVLAIVFIVNSNNSLTGNVINTDSGLQAQKNCRDVQVPYDYLEEYQETVPYTDRECETKDLPYSITNFVETSNTCNEEKKDCKTGFLGVPYDCVSYCVDKSISCSLDLNNLDSEESGTWGIRYNFIERGTSNVIKSQDLNYGLYPQTTKLVPGATRIQSSGKDGDANKNIGCSYNVASVPTKQVCRDVTNYKEVTKTRTVTRYRAEQKCD